MIPEGFEGKFTITRKGSFRFFPGSEEDENFDVWFYRRETDRGLLSEFVESIEPENIGYDKPSQQLFYRSKNGKIYRMIFQEIDEDL